MFRNYFKTAIRNLSRHKLHAIVNITGLTVGFTAFLLIFMIISYEQSYDGFHAKKERIYRLVRHARPPAQGWGAGIAFPIPASLRMDIPQIEKVCAIASDRDVQVLIPSATPSAFKKFKEHNGVFIAEPDFFGMFNFPVLTGNAASMLTEPNTAVLSKDFARRYFGDWNEAPGKIIRAYEKDIRVTAVIENPPANTDFALGMVLSYATFKHDMNDWLSLNDKNFCFVQLPAHMSASKIEALLPGFMDKHLAAAQNGNDFLLQPLNEVHRDSRLGNFSERVFSKEITLALGIIAVFLLVIACVNFINLATANAVTRSKEVGVRKVLGSSRKQLLLQFFGETGIASLLAMLAAVCICTISLPFLNNLLSSQISINILLQPMSLLLIAASLLTVTLIAGTYPALILAGFNPVAALKNRLSADAGKGLSVRRGLVTFQFIIAQVLIIGTMVITAQMNYFKDADMGFTRKSIITARFPKDSVSLSKLDRVTNEIKQLNGVEAISLSGFAPSSQGGWASELAVPGKTGEGSKLIVQMKPADTAYFKLYDLKLLAGRVYFESDTVNTYVVNETVISKLQMGSPQQAIGKMLTVAGITAPVSGVVKNYSVQTLREEIEPVAMMARKKTYQLFNIKIAAGKTRAVLAGMNAIWNQAFPKDVFEYNFLDQSIAAYYQHETRLSQLYTLFAGIAIFISCLGLYGLISFMVIRKKKEIGIRKVLGAPATKIVVMLSSEFTLLITIAFLIAAPIAWYFAQIWLQQYAGKITIGPGFFLLAFTCSLLIAWLSVGYSAIKAAHASPVKNLATGN